MPRHRFGRAENQRARNNLAVRTEEAQMQAAHADLSLANESLYATQEVLREQEGRRAIKEGDLTDELLEDTGANLNALGMYAVVNLIFNALLPEGVFVNETMAFNEHLYTRNFMGVDRKIATKLFDLSYIDYASPNQPIAPTDQEGAGYNTGHLTPDRLNTLAGLITLDQRVMAQLSIAASVVVQEILQQVPSRQIPDPRSNYKTKRVIYVEDLVDYIHQNYSQNITLDPETGDAFERLTKGSLGNFTRSLLKKFQAQAKSEIERGGSVYFDANVPKEYGGTRVTNMEMGSIPSVFDDIYRSRLNAMCTVTKDNVGKVWQSKANALDTPEVNKFENVEQHGKIPFNAVWIGVATFLQGNAGIEFGTRFNMNHLKGASGIKNRAYNTINDLVTSIMSLVALHVVSYALSYSIDAYIRLAIRGAERVDGKIIFTRENVITPQIIFPGIKAALEMYGVSVGAWDKEVAFNLRTNSNLMGLFLASKKVYDIDNSKPGVKRFSNPLAEDPYWTRDRSSQSARNAEWDQYKGNFNDSAIIEQRDQQSKVIKKDKYDAAVDISKSVADYRRIGGTGSLLAGHVGSIATAEFGRSRRRGSKRRHSSKNKARKASFGKKSRGSKKTRGSKKRRGSKKH